MVPRRVMRVGEPVPYSLPVLQPRMSAELGERTPHRDRITFILDALSSEGHVDIDALSEALSVSTATVRRDLDGLAQKQMLIRTRPR
jgi:hypothetical protein